MACARIKPADVDFRVAAARAGGELAGRGILYGVAAAIHAAGSPRVAVTAAHWLALMNGILAVFSLPGAPLNGSRVLRAVLWRR